MKIKVDNYLFNASAQTVRFLDYNYIDLNRILLITNVTDNVIIYNFADAAKGGTVSDNVLTLTYDTTTMNDDDELLIFYQEVDDVISGSEQMKSLENIESTLFGVLSELKIMNKYLLIGLRINKEIQEGDL